MAFVYKSTELGDIECGLLGPDGARVDAGARDGDTHGLIEPLEQIVARRGHELISRLLPPSLVKMMGAGNTKDCVCQECYYFNNDVALLTEDVKITPAESGAEICAAAPADVSSPAGNNRDSLCVAV